MSKPKGARRRDLPPVSFKGSSYSKLVTASKWDFSGKGSSSVFGKQYTVSEGHHWPPPKKAGLSDLGGEFYTTKSEVDRNAGRGKVNMEVVSGSLNFRYNGHLLATNPATAMPPSSESSDSVLDALGAKAIAACAPGNPVTSLATAIGELYKDGLPHLIGSTLWESQANLAKRAGEEYLNYQFGWAPLISDIKSFGNGVVNSDSLLTQYEKDAGKVVRRRYNFPQQRTTDESVVGSGKHPWAPTGYAGAFIANPGVNLVRRRETVRNQWFSGAFTYYLPSGYDSRKEIVSLAGKARQLFGNPLDPEVLWNLAPWSWAADWFFNTGDVISNLTRFGTNGLVMRYGYMMEHTIVTDIYTLEGNCGITSTSPIHVLPLVLRTETKKRRKANPFGFGLTFSGLSPLQVSILAALGITRS